MARSLKSSLLLALVAGMFVFLCVGCDIEDNEIELDGFGGLVRTVYVQPVSYYTWEPAPCDHGCGGYYYW